MQAYDVIIVGGGPTGVALGIELGMNEIKTLILEKHSDPLLSPRAQSLNARSMEFFRRWKIAHTLKEKQLLSPDFPIRGVWCSKLNGRTYAISSSNEQLSDEISPERGLRIPLWLTEEVLRKRLSSFENVTFLKQHAVTRVDVDADKVIVSARTVTEQYVNFVASYVVACDGANSLTRKNVGIEFEALAPPKRVINLVFQSDDLEGRITVEKGFLFYLLESGPGAIGPIDLSQGLWYAQVRDDGAAKTISDLDLEKLLDNLAGFSFSKKIIEAHFWNMHIQLAKTFSTKNRVFLVGDSAHAFVPTGGLGLNTGLGDVVNLGWKLSAVIQQNSTPLLLETYEQERRPIAIRNLGLAQKNADDMMALRKKINPSVDPEGFARGNAELAKQHTYSLGATMGYAYFNSPLTLLSHNQITEEMDKTIYLPKVAPGYFLPHCWIEQESIYDLLSPTNWTLLICDTNESTNLSWYKKFEQTDLPLDIMNIRGLVYPYKYILIRPDWHIAFVGNMLPDKYIDMFLQKFK